jgi:hypothetical protein
MEAKNDINTPLSSEAGEWKDFTMIKNEKNIIKALDNEIVEKNILVKENKPRAYAINLPQPNKLLAFVVANNIKSLAVLWAKEIIE